MFTSVSRENRYSRGIKELKGEEKKKVKNQMEEEEH